MGAALAAAGACASGTPGTRGPAGGEGLYVAGYHAYWTGDAWTTYPWDALDRLYFFEIEAGADGSLADPHGWPDTWRGLLDRAREARVPVVPTVSLHDADAFETLFVDPTRTERLADEVLTLLARTPGLGGVHLDFEVFRPVRAEARDGYTAFVARLARALREVDRDYTLSVFALAFDDADVYDERSLAEIADYVVVQGYDFHHADGSRAGPLGALEGWDRLNWRTVLERYSALGVAPARIVMAVPLYGYEWPVAQDRLGAATRGSAVTIPLAPPPDVMPELPRARARAREHGVQIDPESRTPFYAFHDGTGWRQGWFDDVESLGAKYDFVREHGLGGVAVFPLAYGDSLVWEGLRAVRRTRP
jgi:spore germination protein YaaH